MKQLIWLLSILAVFGCASLVDIDARVADDSIATIRTQYGAINKNIGRYKKVKKDAPGFSAEGGTLEAYFDGKSIKKIVARFYGEMGRTEEEYYYWNDSLIFVFSRERHYDRPLSGKVVSTKESRFYFDKGRMIRWLDENGKQVPASNDGFSEKQNDTLDTSKKLIELARS